MHHSLKYKITNTTLVGIQTYVTFQRCDIISFVTDVHQLKTVHRANKF